MGCWMICDDSATPLAAPPSVISSSSNSKIAAAAEQHAAFHRHPHAHRPANNSLTHSSKTLCRQPPPLPLSHPSHRLANNSLTLLEDHQPPLPPPMNATSAPKKPSGCFVGHRRCLLHLWLLRGCLCTRGAVVEAPAAVPGIDPWRFLQGS